MADNIFQPVTEQFPSEKDPLPAAGCLCKAGWVGEPVGPLPLTALTPGAAPWLRQPFCRCICPVPPSPKAWRSTGHSANQNPGVALTTWLLQPLLLGPAAKESHGFLLTSDLRIKMNPMPFCNNIKQVICSPMSLLHAQLCRQGTSQSRGGDTKKSPFLFPERGEHQRQAEAANTTGFDL